MSSIPDYFTWSRIAAAPLLVVAFWWPGADLETRDLAAATVFTLGALTDVIDGHLARRLRWESRFGAFLDPVADKLFVSCALLLLLNADRAPVVATLVIVGREICISALREWMAELGKRQIVAVGRLGKIKTFAQMLGIGFLFGGGEIGGLSALAPPDECGWECFRQLVALGGNILIWIAAALTLWSMSAYLRAAWPHLSEEGGR